MAASPAVRATLQGAGTQLHDARARKEQLAARVQEVQAMLAMDTGRLRLLPLRSLPVPRGEQTPARPLQPALPHRSLWWGHSHTYAMHNGDQDS